MTDDKLRAYQDRMFRIFLARAARWTALVQSGAYKMMRTERGCGKNDDGTIKFRPLTNDEKLADAMSTIDRHLEHAQKFSDALDEETP
jgi:hypothetical protein